MPISVGTAAAACRIFSENAASRWHQAGANVEESDGALAFQRLHRSPFTPQITPAFKLQRSDKIYAIGSCFARGVEGALVGRKMQVLSRAVEFDSFPQNRNELQLGFVNKYNVFSIYNELSWALDPAARFPVESVVPVGDGLFYDPHTNPSLALAPLAETLRRRAILQSVTARIRECRVVIITLGLVEVWRDMIADTIVNTTPIPEALKLHPDRYEFQLSSYLDTLTTLEKTYDLLSKYGHPDLQIVVTVSPVPLMATFTDQDVVVANTYSKSLLRTCAQEWAFRHTNIHYFPSYEIVQNSHVAEAWEQDLRHVRGSIVQHIMRLFLQHHLQEE